MDKKMKEALIIELKEVIDPPIMPPIELTPEQKAKINYEKLAEYVYNFALTNHISGMGKYQMAELIKDLVDNANRYQEWEKKNEKPITKDKDDDNDDDNDNDDESDDENDTNENEEMDHIPASKNASKSKKSKDNNKATPKDDKAKSSNAIPKNEKNSKDNGVKQSIFDFLED